MKQFISRNLIYIFIIVITGYSCSRIIEIDLPKNQLTDEKVFADNVNANAAITGIYISMMQAFSLDFFSGGITTFVGMSADELTQTVTNINDEFYKNVISNDNSTVGYMWNSAFKYIYATNACLDGIERSISIDALQKEQLYAEVKFLRAFIYFYLVNLYGPTPIVTDVNYQNNRLLSRSSIEEVYDFIKEDLVFAKERLPRIGSPNTRPNYFAATALLARVYLYTQDYELAHTASTEVIDAKIYDLVNSPNDVFLSNSKETIFALHPVVVGRATWEGYYFVPNRATTVPRYIVSETLLNSFDPEDLRKSQWVGLNTVHGTQYHYPNKYKMYSASSSDTERYVMLRLAEQYLIRAEASAYLNIVSEAEVDINKIRQRSGLENFSSDNDPRLLLLEIENQRRFELMCEWGHRWFDLKRTERINEIMQEIKPNWIPNSSLWPIPQIEIENNPNLEQNQGY